VTVQRFDVSARELALTGNPEVAKVPVTGAAGSQVIEPLFRFGECHLMKGDPLENIRARASGTVRIRELLEQTTAQRIQDALFVSLRVSLRVQTTLPCQTLSLLSEMIHPVRCAQGLSAFLT
jgi:hypothetical protein